jgi:hypothetical protein
MAYPIQQLRDLFSIAKDVKDDDLQKAFYEADMLDMSPQLQRVFEEIPAEYLEDTPTLTGAKKVLCYYAFARYLQTSEQQSTAGGLKIQNYKGSYVLADNTKAKRFEAERGKADLFIVPLIKAFKTAGLIKEECSHRVQSRICLIK